MRVFRDYKSYVNMSEEPFHIVESKEWSSGCGNKTLLSIVIKTFCDKQFSMEAKGKQKLEDYSKANHSKKLCTECKRILSITLKSKLLQRKYSADKSGSI